MSSPTVLSEIQPGDVQQHAEALRVLFNACYAPAPWLETPDEIAATVDELALPTPGWRAVIATDRSRHVVGFAEGAHGSVLLGDLEQVDADTASTLPAPLFEFHQLLVRLDEQGKGIGRRLHDTLMADVAEHAILSTHPAAVALYRACGWVAHGQLFFTPDQPRVLMIRPPMTG